jgi:protease I
MTVPALHNLRIAVIATDGVEEPELAGPVRALREAGARAGLLPVKPGQIQAVRHDLQPAQTFAVGTTLDQADPEDCDALLLPGGAVNAGRLRTGPAVRSVLEQADSAGKPMAVICHVPRGLVPARPAGWAVISYNLRDELRDAGRRGVGREAACTAPW